MKRLEFATVVAVCITLTSIACIFRSCTVAINEELTKRQAIAGTNPPVRQILDMQQ